MVAVVAVSSGQPRWHNVYGRQVFTSIVRDASDQPIQFNAGGPSANATAVHTEEVFAFFTEHYDYWCERLGVPRAAWSHCHWGENLLLSGMLGEEDLHIGDRFRVGDALLEITSPRIPCFKLSWRLGQPETFLRELIESGRMGSYMRVIEPGRIGAGDAAHLETREANTISVLALSRLLHDPNATDLEQLRRVLATPALGEQAAGMIRKRLSALTDGRLTEVGRWQGWRSFAIASIQEEVADVRSLRLRPVDRGPIGGYRAGQFLTVRLPQSAGNLVRTWSLSDYDQAADSYRISIKRTPEGAASAWIHDIARVGDIVDVRPPSGRFYLDRSGFMRTVLISAGIGVTPMVAMLRAHAERGDEAPPLLWVHVARSSEAHVFSEEVDAQLTQMPRAVRRVYYSSPRADDLTLARHDRQGRPDSEAIAEMLNETYTLNPFGRSIELSGQFSDFYLCGPKAFEESVQAALLAYGINPSAIRSESFGSSDRIESKTKAPDTVPVHFQGRNRTVTWRRDDDLTLLELAEAEGIAVESACRIGVCGTCRARLHAGTVQYVTAPAAEPIEGELLLCCTQPLSGKLVIELPLR